MSAAPHHTVFMDAPPEHGGPDEKEDHGRHMKEAISEGVQLKAVNCRRGAAPFAREHVMPLEDLVEDNSIEQSAEPNPQENPGRRDRVAPSLRPRCAHAAVYPRRARANKLRPLVWEIHPSTWRERGRMPTYDEAMAEAMALRPMEQPNGAHATTASSSDVPGTTNTSTTLGQAQARACDRTASGSPGDVASACGSVWWAPGDLNPEPAD